MRRLAEEIARGQVDRWISPSRRSVKKNGRMEWSLEMVAHVSRLRYSVGSLLLASAIAAFAIVAVRHISEQLHDGNLYYRYGVTIAATLAVLGLPFASIAIGGRIARWLGFESAIPGMAWGCFIGFLLILAILFATAGY